MIDLSLQYPLLIGTNELAIILGLKPQTIRKYLSGNKLPKGLPRPAKQNGRNKWFRDDIEQYLLLLRQNRDNKIC